MTDIIWDIYGRAIVRKIGAATRGPPRKPRRAVPSGLHRIAADAPVTTGFHLTGPAIGQVGGTAAFADGEGRSA